jgi:hypothetical protein
VARVRQEGLFDNGLAQGTGQYTDRVQGGERQWDGTCGSSGALLPGLFQELHLDGDPVIVTPNRLTLMVIGSRNTAAVMAIATAG